MEVSVAICTHKRNWALKYSLESISKQTVMPEEVLIVLKLSGDGSETTIAEYSKSLPIRLIIQKAGNFTDAINTILKTSEKDIILFIDDDAIAHPQWIEKYLQTFEKLKDCGGCYGLNYLAESNDKLVLRDFEEYTTGLTRGPHRRPMKLFREYYAWISVSGLLGVKKFPEGYCKSALLMGVNMGFRREVIKNVPLDELYEGSRTGLRNEQLLSYYTRAKGFHTYLVNDRKAAPIVWHIQSKSSLSRGKEFKKRFWHQFDDAVMFWRLKALRGELSFGLYLFGLAATCRTNSLPNFFGSVAGFFWGILIIVKYRIKHKEK